MLAQSAMAPDCTPAGKDRRNTRTKEGQNGKEERAAQAQKAPGRSYWLLRHSMACDWLGSRKDGRSSAHPKPAFPVRPPSPQAELSLPRLKLSREPRRGSSTGQGNRKLLYKVPQPQGVLVQCRDLSSGCVIKRSRRAEALLRDCKGQAAARRPPSPDVRNRTCLAPSVCLPA